MVMKRYFGRTGGINFEGKYPSSHISIDERDNVLSYRLSGDIVSNNEFTTLNGSHLERALSIVALGKWEERFFDPFEYRTADTPANIQDAW
jgi:hypothetical protein